MMTMDEYSTLASRTINRDCELLVVATLGLVGESGEVAELLKKHMGQGHELDRAKLAEELGDVLWYVNCAAVALGLSLEQVADGNIQKLLRRYPGAGFEHIRSVNRDE